MVIDSHHIFSVLLWCTIINYALLILWYVLMRLPHGGLYRLGGKPFGVTPQQFDALNLAGIVFYKVLVIIFNLVPLIALWIVGRP